MKKLFFFLTQPHIIIHLDFTNNRLFSKKSDFQLSNKKKGLKIFNATTISSFIDIQWSSNTLNIPKSLIYMYLVISYTKS